MCQLGHPLLEKSFTHSNSSRYMEVALGVKFIFQSSFDCLFRFWYFNAVKNNEKQSAVQYKQLALETKQMFIIWGNSEIPRFTHFLFHLSQHAGTVSGAACCASSYDTSKASSRPPTSYLSLFVCQRFFQNLVMPPELNSRFRCAFDNFFIRWSDF